VTLTRRTPAHRSDPDSTVEQFESGCEASESTPEATESTSSQIESSGLNQKPSKMIFLSTISYA
jgi:hypothetical protein